jgi:subtilisin
MKKVKVVLGLLWLASCERDNNVPTPSADCLVAASAHNGEIIEGEYIITLAESNSPAIVVQQGNNARITALSEQLFEKNHFNPKAIKRTFSATKMVFWLPSPKRKLSHYRMNLLLNLSNPIVL